jgi:phytoene dehydrogenase-like protein
MARIAVIGAGTGAMAAAARLATAGHTVTVHERGDTYGGALHRHEEDGFAFDTGPGLLHLPAVHRDLFVKTGRERLEDRLTLTQVAPGALHVFADGTRVTLPNASRGGTVAALDTAFGPGAGERWGALMTRARAVWDATRRPLLEEPLTPELAGAPVADPWPARRRGLRRRPATLARVAQELRDPRLAALLESHARAWGLDPATTPASAVVLAYLEEAFGVWYVQGGMRELARALHDRCRERGVTFRFGSAVRAVAEEAGRVRGVQLADGSRAEADAVVDGSPPATLPPGSPAAARCTVLLALRGAHPAGTPHRTFVHAAGRLVTVLRPDDPALRPDDDHATAVLSTAVPGPVADPEALAGELVAAADAAGLGLGERTLWRRVRTPRDDASVTGAPDGLVPPPVLAGLAHPAVDRLRAANRAPLAGLYRAGGWAHPGGGLAHTGMSGALAAGLLTGGDDWRGSR